MRLQVLFADGSIIETGELILDPTRTAQDLLARSVGSGRKSRAISTVAMTVWIITDELEQERMMSR